VHCGNIQKKTKRYNLALRRTAIPPRSKRQVIFITMKNKKFIVLYYFLLIFTLLIIFNSSSCAKNPYVESSASSETTQTSSIKLATWNIRILSNGSRDNNELAQIADILKRYDLIVIQETRDITVLNRLKNILQDYNYIASDPVGTSVKEIYAFFYKPSMISTVGTAFIYPDPNDDFIREPCVACFKAGNFDFTLC